MGNEKTPTEVVAFWRGLLVIGGVVMLVAAVLLQLWSANSDSVVTTKTAGDTVTATTSGGGPPDSLIATSLAAAILLLLVASFFSRVEKISAFGIDLTLTKTEEKEVIEEAVKQAGEQGLEGQVTEIVARSLDSARGAKAMARSGVRIPGPGDFTVDPIRDPKVLAQLAVLSTVRSFK